MLDAKGKPINPEKIELNRLRTSRMQLNDSKKLLKSQTMTEPSRLLKLSSINKSLTALTARITGIRTTSNLR